MEKQDENSLRDATKVWRAIYVASRQEKKVNELLGKKGVESYVPLIKTMRQWSDRKKMVELPLLNGYVFAYITPQEQEKTLQTKGVVNFVRIEGKIATVRNSEIDQLKQLVELGYQMEATGIKRNYKEGDKIKITSGALKNIEGYVLNTSDGSLLEIVLESIGQSIKVRLPEEIISPIKR